MDAQIYKPSGETFTLEEYGIIAHDFKVSSIEISPEYQQVDGGDGNIDYGAVFGNRTISVPFTMKAYDLMDYPLLRDKLFSLILDKRPFYIRELRRSKYQAYSFVDLHEPAKNSEESSNMYVGGKRYLVRLQNTFELEQMLKYGDGELVFETTNLPFAESIGTTADIDKNGLTYDSGIWAYGMGLLYEDESHQYTHTGTSFRIYNAGNVPLHHPFEEELKITISDVLGSSSYLELTNTTTGDTFRVNEGVGSDKTIVLDGPNITNNGLQYFRKTNRKFITLVPGWNQFTIKGASSAKVSFDMPFYYL
ncbi:phage tail domain-containing protein [Virgibacillus halophilus]|uniref:phage tail domain-containing protein n=1 Tax=Tigheibacillus halophilus TaxID=361280 RepID=UPI00362B215E